MADVERVSVRKRTNNVCGFDEIPLGHWTHATEGDIVRNVADPEHELTAKQAAVLQSLLGGKTITAAAEAAKVHRNTAGKWLKQPAFRAALNGGLRASQAATAAAIVLAAEKAIEVIAEAVLNGDVKTALTLLRGAGVLAGRPIDVGSDDANIVEQRQFEDSVLGR